MYVTRRCFVSVVTFVYAISFCMVPFVWSTASDHFVPGFSTCHINLPIVFVPLSV